MNKGFIRVFIFAVIVAGIATLLVYRFWLSKMTNAPKPVDTTQVLVAGTDLEEGAVLKKSDISSTAWPKGKEPTGFIPDIPENWKEKDGPVIGRSVIVKMFKGEPLLNSRLAAAGAGAGLEAIIPIGKRAVAVRVNEIIGVAGYVLPGMLVDLIILGAPPGTPATMGTLSKTLLQKIPVVAAGQDIRRDAEGKPVSVPVVTLLVDPAQAEMLTLANNETRIQLVLRNRLDNDEVKTPGTAMARLFGGKMSMPTPEGDAEARPRRARPEVVAPPPPKPKPAYVIEVIQGGQRVESKFQEQPED